MAFVLSFYIFIISNKIDQPKCNIDNNNTLVGITLSYKPEACIMGGGVKRHTPNEISVYSQLNLNLKIKII